MTATTREEDVRRDFGAPWSTKLKVMTVVLVVILAFAGYSSPGWGRLVAVAIALVAAAFAIRGYSVRDGKVMVHRLGWANKFDLAKLSSVTVSPGATMGSIRAMGIGGLFGFVGYYRNEILGMYQAFATNETNTVILDLEGKKIVVTPDDPQEFAQAVETARQGLPTP
jgi:hypothetical protein